MDTIGSSANITLCASEHDNVQCALWCFIICMNTIGSRATITPDASERDSEQYAL